MDKISQDLEKSPMQTSAFYGRLLREIREKMVMLIVELHPDYRRQYEEADVDQPFKSYVVKRVQELCQMSVIRHYLKANAKGHDLHVVFYKDEHEGVLQNLTAAVSEKINAEWNINNLIASQILANEIIKVHQY